MFMGRCVEKRQSCDDKAYEPSNTTSEQVTPNFTTMQRPAENHTGKNNNSKHHAELCEVELERNVIQILHACSMAV